MIRFLLLSALLVQCAAFSKQVNVRLDAPGEIIRAHSAGVTIAIKYSENDISAAELFTMRDLMDGITTKPFVISDEKIPQRCSYRWEIMGKLPGLSVQPDKLELLFPALEQAVNLEKECSIDDAHGEIVLDITPWRMENLSVSAHKSVLQTKNAKFLVSQFKVAGAQDVYPSKLLQLTGGSPEVVSYNAHLMAREDVSLLMKNLWRLNDGTSQTENLTSKTLQVEIK